MIIQVYDTETSDFIMQNQPASHPGQPHLLQYASVLLDSERDWEEIMSCSFIVCPQGDDWQVSPGASKVHGITKEVAKRFGMPHQLAVATHTNLRARADATVAHNIGFDALVMDAAIIRTGRQPTSPGPKRHYCTIKSSEDYVKLPPTPRMVNAGMGHKFKAPNLTELHTFLFNEGFEGAHDALADVRACARCFIELVKRDVIKLTFDSIEDTVDLGPKKVVRG